MHVWFNLTDLTQLGTIGPFGSPLMLMVRQELGDNLLPGAYYKRELNAFDEAYVVVETTQERAEAIENAINVIAKNKAGRTIRVRKTEHPPKPGTWDCVQ